MFAAQRQFAEVEQRRLALLIRPYDLSCLTMQRGRKNCLPAAGAKLDECCLPGSRGLGITQFNRLTGPHQLVQAMSVRRAVAP
jgi:hypothetical protein